MTRGIPFLLAAGTSDKEGYEPSFFGVYLDYPSVISMLDTVENNAFGLGEQIRSVDKEDLSYTGR